MGRGAKKHYQFVMVVVRDGDFFAERGVVK